MSIALHLNSRFILPFSMKRGRNLLGILPTLRLNHKCLCCYDNITCVFKAATVFPVRVGIFALNTCLHSHECDFLLAEVGILECVIWKPVFIQHVK